MKLSARNQLPGVVTKITEGAVNGIVTLDVNGTPVTATISLAAIRELGLEVGKKAYAVIKATEVMVGLGEHLTLSARNQFPGKVMSVEKGAVNSIVRLSVWVASPSPPPSPTTPWRSWVWNPARMPWRSSRPPPS